MLPIPNIIYWCLVGIGLLPDYKVGIAALKLFQMNDNYIFISSYCKITVTTVKIQQKLLEPLLPAKFAVILQYFISVY